jgi:hypothetical protein
MVLEGIRGWRSGGSLVARLLSPLPAPRSPSRSSARGRAEAKQVQAIFDMYLRMRSVRAVTE